MKFYDQRLFITEEKNYFVKHLPTLFEITEAALEENKRQQAFL